MENVVLGLLTGNVRRGAEAKLTHFELWEYFPAGGGFGDHHFNRDDVARSALAAMNAHLGGSIDPEDVWVIGDTPLDVSCARAIGANAVAVATGGHSIDELLSHAPNAALPDLTNHDDLLGLWE